MSRLKSVFLLTACGALLACEAPHIDDYRIETQFVASAESAGLGLEADEIVLAVVDEEHVIRLGDLERYRASLSVSGQVITNPYNQRLELLNALLTIETLNQAGLEAGLADDPEVHAAVASQTADVVLRRLVNSETAGQSPSDEEVDGLLETYDFLVNRPNLVWASLVVVPDRQTARALARRIQNDDRSEAFTAFNQAVEQYGTLPSLAEQRGDLGFVTQEELALVLGTTHASEIFEDRRHTVFGPWAIEHGTLLVFIPGRREPIQLSEEQARNEVRDVLLGNQRYAAVESVLTRAREEYSLEFTEAGEQLQSLSGDPQDYWRRLRPQPFEFALHERLLPRYNLANVEALFPLEGSGAAAEGTGSAAAFADFDREGTEFDAERMGTSPEGTGQNP
ncbi:MAG: hypothetical protein KC561_04120 [Myxococcales bacterium]|nr:hypothetical protein [Myxococcales bacterium]